MEKQEKKTSEIKSWWEKNKGWIKNIGIGTALFGGGVYIGDKICTICTAGGMQKYHEAGIIKFFDPVKGVEVDVEEACEVVKRTFFDK